MTSKFAGATAVSGPESSGRTIPESEGGGIQRGTGKLTKDTDFDQGEPGEGPEDIAARDAATRGGDDDVRNNVVQSNVISDKEVQGKRTNQGHRTDTSGPGMTGTRDTIVQAGGRSGT